MTIEEIGAYLSAEHVSHSADARVTRIFYKNGKVLVAHFSKESQEESLIKQNKWIVTFLDKPEGVSTINGNDISALKAGPNRM